MRTGLNVLHRREGSDEMEESLAKLFARRKSRIPPAVDSKILTAWNGLMIAALARAGRILRRNDYLQAAEEAVDFLLTEMYTGELLLRRYRQGEAAVHGFLDDYSFLAWGLLELYQASFRSVYAEKAVGLTRVMLEVFTVAMEICIIPPPVKMKKSFLYGKKDWKKGRYLHRAPWPRKTC